MNRRSSSIEPPQKARPRTCSWHQAPMSASLIKRTSTAPPPGASVFEKRQSSAELMIQRFKQKFKNMSRQVSGPNPNCTSLHSGFATPGRVRGYPIQTRKDERSLSLNAVYASPGLHHAIFRADAEDDFDATGAWTGYGHACQHRQWRPSRDFYGPPPYREWEDAYDGYGVIEDEENVMEVQKQIYRAKSEAKTVSVVNGCLYINYQYVGPLPSGCVV